ncbi:glycine oxidase ThiO [Priestia megaterium]|nr:glycine oxidase ThiO [Priestia megaterium]
MKAHYDMLIVGGGVIGLSIAYQLSKLGSSVAVFERNRLGCEASSAAAGILGAQAEIDEEGPLLDLAIQSRSMFPSIVEELKEKTNIDVELIKEGLLKVATTEEEAQVLQRKASCHQRWDENVKWLEAKEAQAIEKGLADNIHGAISIPGDGQLAPEKLTQAFAQGALYHHTKIYEYCNVYSLITEKNKVKGIHTSSGTFYGGAVILTTGSWGKELLPNADHLEVFPVKGECVSVRSDKNLLKKTIFLDEGFYLVPKAGGRIVIGATKISHDYTKTVSAKAIQALLEKATRLLPSLSEAEFEKAWAGLRPQTNDGWPYLGPHPTVEGLHMAFGHYRNGILLSAVTGKIIAEAVCESKQNHSFFDSFHFMRTMEGIR